jgi:glycerol-3-phosphate dehydrogenase
MAATVEDVLARRTRALFLNAAAAIAMAEPVAKILAAHFGHDDAWIAAQISEFTTLAQQYRVG